MPPHERPARAAFDGDGVMLGRILIYAALVVATAIVILSVRLATG